MAARIGIVGYWFNRGQATVARYTRSIFDQLGHETFVLARPTTDSFHLPRHISGDDVWAQREVTGASHYMIPEEEYLRWADENALETVFFDQNYQFPEIAALRRTGVRTIGRFVWESFAEKDVEPAAEAFDVIYALTKCEQRRYARMGIDAPFVRWGCHPELLQRDSAARAGHPTLLYPAGYLSYRKPTAAVVEAFRRAAVPEAQLIIKCQRPLRKYDLVLPQTMAELSAAQKDPQMQADASADLRASDADIAVVTDDLPTSEYYRLFASCHVSLAPSRWEGLGLHLFEAAAFGIPTVCNDMPPLNEVVIDGRNGLLTGCFRIGERPNGIPSMEPDPDDLARAIRRVLEPRCLAELEKGTIARREELSWWHTVADYAALLERVK